jgi:hypothetical protein
MKTQYWLADGKEVDSYGTVWNVHLLDGPHEGPEGVATSKKIIQGIGLDRGLNRNYVMAVISDVPDLEVKVNEDAIATCKQAVDFASGNKKV